MDFATITSTLLDLLERFGPIGVFVILLCWLFYKFCIRATTKFADRLGEGKIDFHKFASRKRRKDAVFKVNRLLRELVDKLGADRISVFEYHNGGYNLTGMPFLHFSIMTQLNRVGVDELSKDFDNVLVSSVPEFIQALDREEYYDVPLEDLEHTFPRMYRELVDDGMQEVIFADITGSEEQIGFIMLAFKEPIKVTKKKLTKELSKKIQKMAIYLDGKGK